MRIQDLENRTGLERPSIRFYEREGLITPKRTQNGYRDYTEADAQLLLKIKLLRQLGLSVEKIRQLQQGSADFSEALAQQVQILSSQIDEHKRARVVCQAIQNDGAEYGTLDSDRYLKLLREIRIDDRSLGRTNFQEDIPKEIHPWRRFLARSIDLALFSVVLRFLIFVVFRTRPIPESFLLTLMGIAFGFLYVPVEALLLNRLGTTPGKWAMGIRLEWIQGGNLPYLEAIYRSWRVLKYGMAFGIPYVDLAFHLFCYCKLTGRAMSRFRKYNEIAPPTEMDWDDDTEIIYSEWAGKWLRRILPLTAIWVLLVGVTVSDMVKPKYRGYDLTVAQFASNYNSTLRLLHEDYQSYDRLLSDGTKETVPESVAVVYIGSEPEAEQVNFTYETEESFIRTISYNNSWKDVFYLLPLNSECYTAAVSVLLAQDGCSIQEMLEFTQLWESKQGQTTAAFRYQNLEIQWQIRFENCIFSNGVLFPADQEQDSSADASFVLIIHQPE